MSVERRPDLYALKTHKFSLNNWFVQIDGSLSQLIYIRQIYAEHTYEKLTLQNRLCDDDKINV